MLRSRTQLGGSGAHPADFENCEDAPPLSLALLVSLSRSPSRGEAMRRQEEESSEEGEIDGGERRKGGVRQAVMALLALLTTSGLVWGVEQ
eukprot:3412529-Rhodomonas_salina.3